MIYNSNHAINIKPALKETIASSLRSLMQLSGINECELSRRTGIPQPTLHKILSGKTNDPRASTLRALADYFNISIEELISGAGISTIKQSSNPTNTQSIAIISWSECLDANNFIKKITPANWNHWIVSEFISHSAYALISKPSMELRFPKGTTLIIDPEVTATDGDLVIAHYPKTQEATLRELSNDGPSKLLLPVHPNGAPNSLDDNIRILGVLIKSVFSFHS